MIDDGGAAKTTPASSSKPRITFSEAASNLFGFGSGTSSILRGKESSSNSGAMSALSASMHSGGGSSHHGTGLGATGATGTSIGIGGSYSGDGSGMRVKDPTLTAIGKQLKNIEAECRKKREQDLKDWTKETKPQLQREIEELTKKCNALHARIEQEVLPILIKKTNYLLIVVTLHYYSCPFFF
jgi:hypothetical protein